jgi:hypothetical protein
MVRSWLSVGHPMSHRAVRFPMRHFTPWLPHIAGPVLKYLTYQKSR